MSWKLFGEDVATYQERLGSCLTKSFDISKAPWKLLEEHVTLKQKRRRNYLKNVTTFQERLGSFVKKCCKVTILQNL